MYRGDDYYDSLIKKEEEKIKIAYAKIRTCMGYIKFKNDAQKRSIDKKIGQIFRTDVPVSKKWKIKAKIAAELKKLPADYGYHSSIEVSKTLEGELDKQRVDLDYSDLSRESRGISNDTVEGLLDSISDYINAVQNKENIRERQRTDKENAEKREKEVPRTSPRQYYGSRGEYSTGYGYNREETEAVRRPVPFAGLTEEERKEKIKVAIDAKIAEQYGTTKFTSEEEREIKKIYPELDNYGREYFSVTTLNMGIQMENILNKKTLDARDMMDLADFTYEIMVRELLSGSSGFKASELFNKIKMDRSLEKYKAAYSKFMKYYNSLSQSEQAALDRQIVSSKYYTDKFGDSIITPEDLTRKINSKVRNEIVENRHTFYNYRELNIYSKTNHATRYMSIEEIAQLYHMLKEKEERSIVYGANEEEQKLQEEYKEKRLATLQREFARVILSRLQTFYKAKDITTMTEEEKEAYFEKENKRLSAIITEVLHEKPLQESLKNVASERERKEEADALIGTYNAKKSAKEKVYGISKVAETLAKITGKWQRYLMLLDKEELTEKEQEEMKNMFK